MAGDSLLVISGNGIKLAVSDIVAPEALKALRDELLIARLFSHKYAEHFGAKYGDKLTIVRPFKAKAVDGRVMSANALVDRTLVVKLDKTANSSLEFDADTAALTLDKFTERYLSECATELAYKYDEAGGRVLVDNTYFTDGTPGEVLSSKTTTDAMAHWGKLDMPQRRDRMILVDHYDIAAITKESLEGNYNNPADVNSAVHESFRGKLSGFSVYTTNHLPDYTVQDYGASIPLVNYSAGGDTTYEGDSLPTDGWVANTKVLLKGQMITIAGVYEIRPRGNRASNGILQTFVVKEDITATAAGAAVIKVSPEINAGTLTTPGASGETISLSAYQTVSAPAADGAVITIVGAGVNGVNKGKSFRQAVMCLPQTMHFTSVTLPRLEGLVSRFMHDPETGLGITYYSDSTISNITQQNRLDVLFGVNMIRDDISIRLLNGQVGG